MKNYFGLFSLIIIFGSLVINSINGYVYTVTVSDQLEIPDKQTENHFGSEVSISEKYGVVGSFGDNDYAGSAYVFSYDGLLWTLQAKLTASDGYQGDYFGITVSNQDEIIVVGAMGHDVNGIYETGAVYTFEMTSNVWSQQAKLLSPVRGRSDYFGVSVRVGIQTLIAGAFGENAPVSNSGAAYVYNRIDARTWTLEAKLLAFDGDLEDYFGSVVDIDRNGTLAAVTAFGDDDRRGSLYIFEKRGVSQKWTQTTKILPADRSTIDYANFGISMRLHLDTIVVGAYRDKSSGQWQGSAYIFENVVGSWTQTTKLRASDLSGDDMMGGTVALFGDTVLVNTQDDDMGRDSGAVYVFRKEVNSQWSQQMKILAADGARDDLFGLCLALHDKQSLIAAPYANSSAGSVYPFIITSAPTFLPSISSMPTSSPSFRPSNPTYAPSLRPSRRPTNIPTSKPTTPTISPTRRPTTIPSLSPTRITSMPTELLVTEGRSDESQSSTTSSLMFIVFISVVGVSSLFGLYYCICGQKSRVENVDADVQLTQIVAGSHVLPEFAARHAVASAVFVPNSNSNNDSSPSSSSGALAAPSSSNSNNQTLIFTNAVLANEVESENLGISPIDVSLPVAIVIP